MASEKFITNWPRGTKVIMRSNEPGPLIIGVIKDYFDKGDMAVVKSEEGRLVVCGGAMSVFDEDRLAALNKLNWHEQYNVMTHWGRSVEITDEWQDSRFLELLGAYADAYHHEEQCRLQIDCPSSRARNAVDNAKGEYAEAEHLTKQALSRLMARLTQSRDSDSDWVVYHLESRMYYTQYLTMATIQEALRFSKDDAQRLVDRYRREGETGWVCFSREGFK